jgi:hypothetical protein
MDTGLRRYAGTHGGVLIASDLGWLFDGFFCFNAPRWISCVGPLIAGTLIVGLGGYGPAATLVGLFFILGIVAAPFLPETRGQPLPDTVALPEPALTS